MSTSLLIVQTLNGLQFGVLLFLIAAFGGYTPVLWGLAGIMLIAAMGFAAATLLSKRQAG